MYNRNVFTRIKSSPTTKRKYLQICKSFRKDGKISQKVVGSLGAIDDLIESGEIEKIASSLLALINKNVSEVPEIKEIKRYQWGALKVIEKLWEVFEIDSFLKQQKIGAEFNFRAIILLLVLDRFMHPRSKLKTYENASTYFGVNDDEIALQHIYRSLDILAALKPSLEKHLFDINRTMFNMQVDIVFFDATTVYFHSDKADDLRKFGFSKDCKFKDVQVVLGLIMDQVGRPVGFEVFPGNTFDGHTAIKALITLKEKFDIKKLIFVGDRGICNDENLKTISDAGYEYIVGMPLKRSSKALQQNVLDLDSYQSVSTNNNELKYKVIEQSTKIIDKKKKSSCDVEERIIATWSSSRARKDAKDRAILIDKAQEVLDGKSKLRKPGKAKYLEVSEEVKYLDTAKILEDQEWDGIYGIRTNNLAMSKEAIYEQYHQLWRIEDCFRVMKSHLKIRPVYHWKPSRVTGHLVLCFLTFVFERHMEIELRAKKIEASPAKIREAITQMQASLVEIDQREYLLRSQHNNLAKEILKMLGLTTPQELSLRKEF